MRLFSSFDSFYFLLSVSLILLVVWVAFSPLFKINLFLRSVSSLILNIENFFFSMKPLSFNKFFSFLCVLRILIFFLFNFRGVWPYNFAFTSQLGLIIFISLLFWVSLVAFSLSKNLKGFISHLVPEGTPIYLTWFLFFIEIIRNCIRPLTLTIRLMANILAGHLLMILLFGIVYRQSVFFPFYLLLNSVELFVSVIQSYIFFTIICLYYSES